MIVEFLEAEEFRIRQNPTVGPSYLSYRRQKQHGSKYESADIDGSGNEEPLA